MDIQIPVPEDFLQVTKASTTDILEDGRTVIALCTASGQLLELIDNKVTDSCDIDRVADNITSFTSYDPLQKYYLLRCKKSLVVVKRSKPFSVIKTYEDVNEVTIQDRLRIGRPQVVIRTQTDKEPIITDFVGQLLSAAPRVVPLLTASLRGKLQEMNARVSKAHRLVQERRSARMKALYHLTPHLHPPVSETECEPRVLAWGSPISAPQPVASPPLLLSHPWKKTHNEKWIIGLPVFNSTRTTVHDVKLRLHQSSAGVAESQLKYRSLVVGFGQRSSKGAEWTEPRTCGALTQILTEIVGQSSAMVVGVLEEPLFKKSSIVSISGAIIYTQTGQCEVQDMLGADVHFKVEDLIKGSLVPFSPQNSPDETDLVSVIVSSRCWKLSVSPRHRMAAPLAGALAGLGLIQMKDLGCWVSPPLPGGSLAGLLVIGSGATIGDHTLLVYARDAKQVLHFAHSLHVQWKVEVHKDSSAATVQDCTTNIKAELCTLHAIARPGAEYSAEEWDKIRSKLNQLELATDISFALNSSF